MHSCRLRPIVALFLSVVLTACATTSRQAPEPTAPPQSAANDNLNSTLWMQTSAEYAALLRGIYAQARQQLDVALVTPGWDALAPSERPIRSGFEALPPAVIVDVDETMLDNSPFQARGIRDDQTYTPERWLGWSEERRARALPGALEFARAAADRGVTVYFLTNRLHVSELDTTADNLLALGFPVLADRSNLLLKGDPRASASAKAERRAFVGARHRVLLMVGDQLSDFIDGDDSQQAARASRAAQHSAWWGERWFMLPNPAYGDWERVLGTQCDPEQAKADRRSCLRSSLRMN